jgi:hypothetical protein
MEVAVYNSENSNKLFPTLDKLSVIWEADRILRECLDFQCARLEDLLELKSACEKSVAVSRCIAPIEIIYAEIATARANIKEILAATYALADSVIGPAFAVLIKKGDFRSILARIEHHNETSGRPFLDMLGSQRGIIPHLALRTAQAMQKFYPMTYCRLPDMGEYYKRAIAECG